MRLWQKWFLFKKNRRKIINVLQRFIFSNANQLLLTRTEFKSRAFHAIEQLPLYATFSILHAHEFDPMPFVGRVELHAITYDSFASDPHRQDRALRSQVQPDADNHESGNLKRGAVYPRTKSQGIFHRHPGSSCATPAYRWCKLRQRNDVKIAMWWCVDHGYHFRVHRQFPVCWM